MEPSQLNSILIERKIYSSLWGQLFYTENQHFCVTDILSSIEETFGIYLSSCLEYFRKKNIAYNNYYNTLDRMSLFYPDARARGLTECVQCGGCCWTWPCDVTDEEIIKISAYLGISESEFKEKHTVVIDGARTICRKEWNDVADTPLYGERIYDVKTPCEFFDDNTKKCAIHSVKPAEGRAYCCWLEKN